MKVLGLVVEYNPFHNGHLYHIEESKRITGADSVVCVMSGNFIQRGEPAIVNKWARARMALLAGVNLVIELPVIYAMASAEFFSYAAVKLLDSLGVVDYISFGSENGRLDELDLISDILINEPEDYRLRLKQQLATGISYPAARETALGEYLKETGRYREGIETTLSSSNNILGIEYLKALKKLESRIEPYTIKRISNEYTSEELTGSISSATAIRKYISNKVDQETYLEKIKGTLPETSLEVLQEEFSTGRGPVFPKDFECIILSQIRRMTVQKLSELPYVSEGLENRIKEAAERSGTLEELIEAVCTRRYTRTRIQRALFNLVTGLTSSEFDKFNHYGGPQYIRVLGFNGRGRKLLTQINANAMLPVVIKTSDFKRSCNVLLARMLEIEALSTDMYVLAYDNPAFRMGGQEFTQNLVRFNHI